MKRRREAHSSVLSFIDTISCGFGAVLLLFILTAQRQINEIEERAQETEETASSLQASIKEAEARKEALEAELQSVDPDGASKGLPSPAKLASRREQLAQAIEEQKEDLQALESEAEEPEAPGSPERPSADRRYLTGLQLRGPRVVILLESAGSMLAETAGEARSMLKQGDGGGSDKWKRAKATVRAVLAAIPKGTKVAVLSMNENTRAISGSPAAPYIDPYNNDELLPTLEQLEQLEAEGGANLGKALKAASALPDRPSSLLLIGDGLPTAPAPSAGNLTEADRVRLFKRATANPPNYPFNAILLPFDKDPAAAGLFWRLSTTTRGVTMVPDEDWPPKQ
ncbi:MAG: hypothetical protein ACLFUF_06795 [Opitutales bacterium]